MKKLGVFLLVFGASALFNRAQLSSVDEGFIFNTTAALVEKHSWTMDEELSGRRFSRFSPLPSLFAAPFYATANWLINVEHPTRDASKIPWLLFAFGLSTCVLTAWTAVAFFGLLRSFNYSEESAVWTSLLWAFGTLAFPYSSSLFHQVAATLLLVYVVRFAFAERTAATAIATSLLVSVQLTLAAAVLPLVFRDGLRPNRRSLIGLTLGILGGFGLHVLTNWLRGDHWLHGAYETESFTTPTFVGTVGLFFSSGKGLLWFAPLAFVGMVMLLPFAHRRPEIGRPLLLAVACHCLVVIHWWAWHGSLSWGPRLLLPVLPLMMIPIADMIERRHQLAVWQPRLLASVAALSILINVWAALLPMIGFVERIPNGPTSEWVFVPSLSPLIMSVPENRFFKEESGHGPVMFATKCLLVLVICIGINLLRRKPLQPESRRRLFIPWIPIGFAIAAFTCIMPAVENIGFQLLLPQKGGAVTHFKFLDLPIRGVYRIEIDGLRSGALQIGSAKLTPNAPVGFIEAPPMSASITPIDAYPNHPHRLLWTIPGDGQYRTEIPGSYFHRTTSQYFGRDTHLIKHGRWVLLLLLIPFYFDWLLGGRMANSHLAAGLPAVREDKAAD